MNIQTRGQEKILEAIFKIDENPDAINEIISLNTPDALLEGKLFPKPRKPTIRTTRLKGKNTNAKSFSKIRGRRIKKAPYKTPDGHVETRIVESLYYDGSYVQVGDIVSLVDAEDNVYYAQIRGLLVDTHLEKSAFLTWLLPSTSSPPPNIRFDPATYIIGYEEESPRKLNCLKFIMHCPSDYYYDKTTPYPKPYFMYDEKRKSGFIWTSLRDCAAPGVQK